MGNILNAERLLVPPTWQYSWNEQYIKNSGSRNFSAHALLSQFLRGKRVMFKKLEWLLNSETSFLVIRGSKRGEGIGIS